MTSPVLVWNDVCARGLQPSLLVVLGNGPSYNAATDVPRRGFARVIVTQEAFAVGAPSRLLLSSGYTASTDARRTGFSQIVQPYQEQPQPLRATRLVTDQTAGPSDIFVGFDTEGWDWIEKPPWMQALRGLSSALNVPSYNAATDVTRLRRLQPFFVPAEVWVQPLYSINQLLLQTSLTGAFSAQGAFAGEAIAAAELLGAFTGGAAFAGALTGALALLGAFSAQGAYAGRVPSTVGFRVMAVSPGVYGGTYYQRGDVFDIVSSDDYSDSTQNYQSAGGEWAPGWMLEVSATTPLYQALAQEGTPLFPIDPKHRRTVM